MDAYKLDGIIFKGHAADLINSLHQAGLPLKGSPANRGYTLKTGNTTILVVNKTMQNNDQEWHLRVVKIPKMFITGEKSGYYEVMVTDGNKWRIINSILGAFDLKLPEEPCAAFRNEPAKRTKTSMKKKCSSIRDSKTSLKRAEKVGSMGSPAHPANISKSQKNMGGKDEFEFAKKLQQEADKQARKLRNAGISGAKCWYCDAKLIENGATRAFVGINPAGGKSSEQIDIERGSLEAPYSVRGYNSWLDEDGWEGKGRQHQARVKQMFESMYGRAWAEKLRETACLNVVPLRTGNASEIPATVWDFSYQWFGHVIEHVRPKLILCNGNGEIKSPWAVLCSLYRVNDVKKIPVGAPGSTASIKETVIESEVLMGTRIIGMPLLNRFGWPETFSALATLGPFF